MDIRDIRNTKWFWIDSAVLTAFAPIIGVTAFAVYAALVEMASTKTPNQSISGIAQKLKISNQEAYAAIKELIRVGLIAVDENQTADIYSLLTVPKSLSDAPAQEKRTRL